MPKVLFIGSHYDDEVFILTRLKYHLNKNDKVYFVYTTSPEKNSFLRKRNSELKNALKSIGVDSSFVKKLNYPDRKSFIYIRDIYLDLKDIINSIKPEIIYIPAYEGGNVDHDVAHVAAVKANKSKKNQIFEYTIYNAYNSPIKLIPYMYGGFIPSNIEAKERKLSPIEKSFVKNYFKKHKSQYLKTQLFALMMGRRDVIVGYERYRKLAKHNYLQKPYKTVSYEFYQKVSFNNFIKSYKTLIKEISNRSVSRGPIKSLLNIRDNNERWESVYIKNLLKL